MGHIGQKIEFSSPEFPPNEEDGQLVNNQTMHGHALAAYLAARLPAKGFEVAALIPEDWGWWCEVRNDAFPLAYGCSSYERGEDFAIFVTPDKPRVRRWFKTIDVSREVDALNDALFAILAESGKATRGPVWTD